MLTIEEIVRRMGLKPSNWVMTDFTFHIDPRFTFSKLISDDEVIAYRIRNRITGEKWTALPDDEAGYIYDPQFVASMLKRTYHDGSKFVSLTVIPAIAKTLGKHPLIHEDGDRLSSPVHWEIVGDVIHGHFSKHPHGSVEEVKKAVDAAGLSHRIKVV